MNTECIHFHANSRQLWLGDFETKVEDTVIMFCSDDIFLFLRESISMPLFNPALYFADNWPLY